MASATAVASSMSSTPARRLHYQQSQLSNGSYSLNQNFAAGEILNLNDSLSLPTISINPLVTIVYSNTTLSQGMLE
jgi:hypothetical protein